MVIISTRDFRANQGKYFNLAAQGEDVVLKSRDKGAFRLVPIKEDDTIISKEEFEAKIQDS